MSAVARRHALTAQQLFGWRRVARRVTKETSAKGSIFAPVIVEAAPPTTTARAEQAATIEITMGIATVRFPVGIDAVALAAVLRAVRAVA